MKKYHLLTKRLYIFLKQYPEWGFKYSYSELSRRTGMTRPTVAKEYNFIKEVINSEGDLEIQNLYLGLDINKYQRAVYILQDLLPDKELTLKECARLLGVSYSVLTNSKVKLRKKGEEISDDDFQKISGGYVPWVRHILEQ